MIIFNLRDDLTDSEENEFRQKVRKCLDDTKSLLKGPNGQTLTARLAEPNSAGVITKIDLFRKVGRQDAKHYDLEMDCPTIVHEILHLHGLVDVYTETQKFVFEEELERMIGKNPENIEGADFNCRHHGPTASPSVMSDQLTAFMLAKNVKTNVYNVPVCVKGGGIYYTFDSDKNSKTCEGGQWIDRGNSFAIAAEGSKQEEKLINEGRKFHYTIDRPSLLYPAEFNSITQPGCSSINGLYYNCAANAYVSSKKTLNCLPTPKECSDKNRWLGIW